MDTISVKLPEQLRRRIAAEARRRNVSQSTIVRESLELQLTDQTGKSGELSCADLAGDLIGSVRAGRRDLSTNKALIPEAIGADVARERQRRR